MKTTTKSHPIKTKKATKSQSALFLRGMHVKYKMIYYDTGNKVVSIIKSTLNYQSIMFVGRRNLISAASSSRTIPSKAYVT